MPADISVKIDRPYGIQVSRSWLKRVMAEALARENIPSVEVSLVITGDGRIQTLNRTYRGVDAPTDVLAFALREDGDEAFVTPADGLVHLGEVVVSYPRAVHQAKEQAHSTQRELALLVVHGLLHLLGYDHEKVGPARKMRAREREILEHLKEKQLC